MKTPISIKYEIRQLTLNHGFDAVGFAAPLLPEKAREGLQEFLTHNHHGDMWWMEREQRADPKAIWLEAKTIIILGQNYGPDHDPMRDLQKKNNGVISVYAQGKDYHDIIKKKLKALARDLQSQFGGDFKVFTDTAPIMEKPLAEQAGLGWQGKHTCIVSREFGSWLFLGEIFTTIEIEPDSSEQNHCGSCSRCIDICPTHAFTDCGKLDARKCISYLTIEHKGHIAEEFRAPMGNRIYGCDDCLAVCPWNKFAETAREIAYHSTNAAANPSLAELVQLDDVTFRARFSGSPIKRIGRDRFIRNVLIAMGNSGDESHISLIIPLLADASELVRAMAVWALQQLSPATLAAQRLDFLSREKDDTVIEEWNRGMTHG